MEGRRDDDQLTPRLVAIAVLGFLLFVPPLLSLFDRPIMVFGVPLLWVYLFGAWAAVVGLVAAVVHRSTRGPG
jgi:hypothetical protein